MSAQGYQKAQYRVSPVGQGYYDWQYDDEVDESQDGYAGCFGKAIDQFQLFWYTDKSVKFRHKLW